MKTYLFSITLLIIGLFSNAVYAQQIGNGNTLMVSDINAPLLSGLYNTNPNSLQTGFPAAESNMAVYLLAMRSIATKNFQLQVASNFMPDDRLFFRKLSIESLSNAGTTNVWHELATRGANTFTSDQIVNGEIRISGSGSDGRPITIHNASKTQSGQAQQWKIWNMTGDFGNSLQFWAYDQTAACNGGLCASRLILMDNGNVGIGITPSYKLDVYGTTHTTGMEVDGEIRVSGSGSDGRPITIHNASKTQSGQAQQWKIWNMTGDFGNSLQFWAYDQTACYGGLCASRLTLMDNGNVGIGMIPSYKLDVCGTARTTGLEVNGNIRAKEVKVEATNWNWPDFVFSSDYQLPSLQTVSNHIKENKHLPGIPPVNEVETQGVNVGEMQARLLQKIEELTLYAIQQQEMIDILIGKIEKLETR